MLRMEGLTAGYAGGTTLREVRLEVAAGSVHAVVGVNGAGKTTLVHAVAGLVRAHAGRVLLDGRDLTGLATHRRARAGVALVPQGRRVFASLTVAEHLAIAHRRDGEASWWTPARVLDLLPQLATRRHHRGGTLSGGEQQMLAIARALLAQPRLLLLDEPTEGLAPRVTHQIQELIATLAGGGQTILVTAPQPDLPRAVADQLTVLAAGRAAASLTGRQVADDPAALRRWLSPAAPTRPAPLPVSTSSGGNP